MQESYWRFIWRIFICCTHSHSQGFKGYCETKRIIPVIPGEPGWYQEKVYLSFKGKQLFDINMTHNIVELKNKEWSKEAIPSKQGNNQRKIKLNNFTAAFSISTCHLSTCYVTWPTWKIKAQGDFCAVQLKFQWWNMNLCDIKLRLGVSRSHSRRNKLTVLNVYNLQISKAVKAQLIYQ